MDSWQDEELVRAFRETGDNECFDHLYQRHRRAIFACCLHFLRDPAQAEDLCHDVFVSAYERFSSLEGERFLPWVRRIAQNLCLNRLRHERVRQRADPVFEPQAMARDSADDQAIARQQLEIASSVLRTLPEEQKRVFLLFHANSLSYREIAERTGYSGNEVRSYLQNSRRNFRLRFERALQGES